MGSSGLVWFLISLCISKSILAPSDNSLVLAAFAYEFLFSLRRFVVESKLSLSLVIFACFWVKTRAVVRLSPAFSSTLLFYLSCNVDVPRFRPKLLLTRNWLEEQADLSTEHWVFLFLRKCCSANLEVKLILDG